MTMSFRNNDAFRQALMLGLAQNPLPDNGISTLATLALFAARNRYQRPAVPSQSSAEKRSAAIEPPSSALLPANARALLIRLFTGKDANAGDGIAVATVQMIKRAGFRLHPFDYSRLEDFIARFADQWGRPERHWLNAIRPERRQADMPYDEAPITEETLPAASKAQKLAFLQNLRRTDPERARSIIETLITNEPANIRADLADILTIGLDQGDRTFLETVSTDRAQSVREAAERLLARLPGTDAYRKKLERARDQITIKKTGLLRRRAVLSLRIDPRPNVTHVNPMLDATEAQAELFHGIKLADLATALEMSVDELIAGCAQSVGLGHLILKCAVLEGLKIDLNLFSTLLAGDDGGTALFLLRDVIPSTSGEMRSMLLERALAPANWGVLPAPFFFQQVYDFLREPLSVSLAANLLGSSIWRDAFQSGAEASKPFWAQSVAPLIPRALSEDFINDVEPHSRRAALYHRLLLALPEQPQ